MIKDRSVSGPVIIRPYNTGEKFTTGNKTNMENTVLHSPQREVTDEYAHFPCFSETSIGKASWGSFPVPFVAPFPQITILYLTPLLAINVYMVHIRLLDSFPGTLPNTLTVQTFRYTLSDAFPDDISPQRFDHRK